MTQRSFATPPVWDDATLDSARLAAIGDFVDERMREGKDQYRALLAKNIAAVRALFDATNDLLDFADGSALAADSRLTSTARYLGGPPVSEADLNTLADAKVAKRKRLDSRLARLAASVIDAALDPERFPWMFEAPRRSPRDDERETAVRWTAGLQAVQQIQTERRRESASRQEKAVEQLLAELEFTRAPRRPIDVTGGLRPGEFSREALVVGTKCDVPVGLRDGRLLFLECKVSNSATNSVKRLNRETGGKADLWRRAFGDRAITGAVLAGVFKLRNLTEAQNGGITIFWERDLGPLAEFLTAAR